MTNDDVHGTLQNHVQALLDALSLNSDAGTELADTPERFASLLRDRFVPVEPTPLRPLASEHVSQSPVVIGDIPYHALCAHHIVPFFGTAHIAYLPSEHIAGFGAFTRLVDELSRGPQLQERFVQQIAEAIDNDLQPRGVLVRLHARQMCMELTGHPGVSNTIVYAARGVYQEMDAPQMAQHAATLFPQPKT